MGTNSIAFNVELAGAYGSGMVDAQNIRQCLTKDNARNFLALPDDVPAPESVATQVDAYRLGYWSECSRIARGVLGTNGVTGHR